MSKNYIFFLQTFLWVILALKTAEAQRYTFDFYDSNVTISVDTSFSVPFQDSLTIAHVRQFYQTIDQSNYINLVNTLIDYKDRKHLNDWVYYQLIRRIAEKIAPKKENYVRYTLYKWFLLCKSGYDARLAIGNNQLIFFVRNKEDISDICIFRRYAPMYSGHMHPV